MLNELKLLGIQKKITLPGRFELPTNSLTDYCSDQTELQEKNT